MSRIKYALVAVIILTFVVKLVPAITEMQFNLLSSDKEIYVSKEVSSFHKDLFIADLHADSLLWKRKLYKKSYRGHVDMPRLRDGNVSFQYFTVVTKSPKGLNIEENAADSDNITTLSMAHLWPIPTWTSLLERAIYQAEVLHKYVKKDPYLMIIKNKADFIRFLNLRQEDSRWMAVSLGLEGAHAIENDLDSSFLKLVDLGYTMMAPVHLFDNKIAGSMQGVDKGGLTTLGRRFVAIANEHNILIDLAHASVPTIEEILELSTKPLIVSHTGLKGHCDTNRNLPDDLAKEIVRKGGLIGIGFWPEAMCGYEVDDVVSAIVFAIDLLGEDHVALGSDFDGAVRVPFTVDKMAFLTQRLVDAGLSKVVIRKIMGENTVKFLSKNLPN